MEDVAFEESVEPFTKDRDRWWGHCGWRAGYQSMEAEKCGLCLGNSEEL